MDGESGKATLLVAVFGLDIYDNQHMRVNGICVFIHKVISNILNPLEET